MEDIEEIINDITSLGKSLVAFFDKHLEPRRIRKMADAYKYASEVQSKIEARKIENVAKTIEKADKLILKDDVLDSKVSEDWIFRFFEEVSNTSDEDIQDLFAMILAGELEKPGRFSKRTIAILGEMSKEEAELFIKALKFNVVSTEVGFLIDTIENEKLLNYVEKLTLENCGLIKINTGLEYNNVNGITVDYGIRRAVVKAENGKTVNVNMFCQCSLTKAGYELYEMIKEHKGISYDYGLFKKYVISLSKNNNLKGDILVKIEGTQNWIRECEF